MAWFYCWFSSCRLLFVVASVICNRHLALCFSPVLNTDDMLTCIGRLYDPNCKNKAVIVMVLHGIVVSLTV